MGSVDVMWLGFVGKGWDARPAVAVVGRPVAKRSKVDGGNLEFVHVVCRLGGSE